MFIWLAQFFVSGPGTDMDFFTSVALFHATSASYTHT